MKITIASIIAIIIFIVVINISTGSKANTSPKANNQDSSVSNVNIIEGKQIIEIIVDGGYSPRNSIAKADTPTIIRFVTKNTFDCSSAVRIQSLNISRNLPSTGTTDIEIPSQPVGVLKGSCGMGMYPFQIEFK